MEEKQEQAIIEAMLFANGHEVSCKSLMVALEKTESEIQEIINAMMENYANSSHGIELIKVNNSYQLVTKKEYYEYIYPLLDNRVKPNLSAAALEVLSIIAYHPKITRSQIENIRGVASDGPVYKLLEFELIEVAGKLDAPGRPTTYQVTDNFLKIFGISSLEELPELPRYKLDENEQIVIDEVMEAPMPERVTDEINKNENNEE